MADAFEVQADSGDVAKLLREGLSPEEYALIKVSPGPASEDPFSIERRNDLPDIWTIVQFTASAIASGVVYDLAKKVAILLERTYSGRFKKKDGGN